MAEARINTIVTADVDTYVRAYKRAKQATKDLADAHGLSVSEMKAVQRNMDRVGQSSQRMKRGVDAGRKAAEAIQGPLGSMTSRTIAAGEAVALLGPVGGPVAAAVAGLGLLAVGLGASVIAAGAVGVALVSLVANYEELAEEVERFRGLGLGVSDVELGRLERANAALDANKALLADVQLTIASGVAPSVERMAVLTLAAGLAAVDSFNAMVEGAGGFERFLAKMVGPDLFVLGVRKMVEGITALLDLAGIEAPAAVGQFEQALANIEDQINDLELKILDTGLSTLEFAMGDYVDQAREMIDVQVEANRELANTGNKAEEIVPTLDAIAAGNLGIGLATSQMVAVIRQQVPQAVAEFQRLQQAQQDAIDLASATAQSSLSSTQTIIGNIRARYDAEVWLTSRQQKEVLRLFRIQQAAGIVSALISGAVASGKAIEQFGPPPSPLGIAGLAAAALVTAANVAAIASQAPPTFNSGGMFTAAPQTNTAPNAHLEDGEYVFSKAAVRRYGRQNLDAMNAGGGGGTVQVVQVGHRVIDAMWTESARRPGSATAAAHRAGKTRRRLGHTRRRR